MALQLLRLRRSVPGASSWAKPFSTDSARYRIKTINAISPVGLNRFPADTYDVSGDAHTDTAHAILLRSHKMQAEDVPLSCRAIARCGAGTNNCNVPLMTELGIPVFNTPGANANAVKELVLCGLFLASRRIVAGSNHMLKLHGEGTATERVEKDKKMFGGREIAGKTLGVIGLGAIGAATTDAALALGMEVIGYDPTLSVEAALKLPGKRMTKVDELEALVPQCDYISLHAPYIPEVTHHMFSEKLIGMMKPDASILNFARGELVDAAALRKHYEGGATGTYVCDFPCDELWEHPQCVLIPHLGASTEEAEEQAAAQAADTIRLFLETGTICDSVNFPTTKLPNRPDAQVRITIINENKPGMLGSIMAKFGEAKLNVMQQINTSRGDIAYNVVDVELPAGMDQLSSWDSIQKEITSIQGVKSTRLIRGAPGAGYAVQRDGVYIA